MQIVRTQSKFSLISRFGRWTLQESRDKLAKIEDEVTKAYIDQEVLRCKWEEKRTKDRSAVFHDATRRWMQGRQKIIELYEQLPDTIVKKASEEKVFPRPEETGVSIGDLLSHKEGKSPLADLRSMHEKIHRLREIFEEEVDKALKKI